MKLICLLVVATIIVAWFNLALLFALVGAGTLATRSTSV